MSTESLNGNMHPTVYWHELPNGKVQCDLCHRYCNLSEGQRGLCFVRACCNNQIVLTTYGRSSGFCIDPIEKKPLNHFMPGTPVLSFGTAGCNLACKFCQNWDISKSREFDTLANVASPDTIAKAAAKHQCNSVAFTYNDPIIFMEYAVDVAKACHDHNIKTVAVTAGEICPEPRKEFFRHIDAANVDLKAFTDRFYHKICGGRLQSTLDTLKYIKNETNIWLELTTLIIPAENDSCSEIDEMTSWVVQNLGPDVPIHFSAFHPAWKMLETPSTPPQTLTMAREIALKNGLLYPYTGNVHNKAGDTTYCRNCKSILIERDWYIIKSWNMLDGGKCKNCGTKCPGIFNNNQNLPGNWGDKRLPIQLK